MLRCLTLSMSLALTHIVLAVLCIVILLGIVYSRKRAVTIGLILAAGLLYGPFFPNLMAISFEPFPGRSPRARGRAFVWRGVDRLDGNFRQ